jgi:hypothetical protein
LVKFHSLVSGSLSLRHGRPQVANGGAASNMESSYEYTNNQSLKADKGWSYRTKCGPTAWGWDVVLTTLHLKLVCLRKVTGLGPILSNKIKN